MPRKKFNSESEDDEFETEAFQFMNKGNEIQTNEEVDLGNLFHNGFSRTAEKPCQGLFGKDSIFSHYSYLVSEVLQISTALKISECDVTEFLPLN